MITPNNNRIRIEDIAKEMNVAPSTVSRALQNHSRIGDETKKRVIKIATEMGYFSQGKYKLTSISIPILLVTYPNNLSHTIVNDERLTFLANRNNFAVQFFPQSELQNVEVLYNYILERNIKYVISFHPRLYSKVFLDDLIRKGVSIVTVNSHSEITGAHEIIVDIFQGCYDAYRHLAHKGVRTIALLEDRTLEYINRDLKKALRIIESEKGLESDKDMVLPSNSNVATIKNWILKLKKEEKLPPAIMAPSYKEILLLRNILPTIDKHYAKEVHMLTFAFDEVPSLLMPKINTIEFPLENLYQTIFNRLSATKSTRSADKVKILKPIFKART